MSQCTGCVQVSQCAVLTVRVSQCAVLTVQVFRRTGCVLLSQ